MYERPFIKLVDLYTQLCRQLHQSNDKSGSHQSYMAQKLLSQTVKKLKKKEMKGESSELGSHSDFPCSGSEDGEDGQDERKLTKTMTSQVMLIAPCHHPPSLQPFIPTTKDSTNIRGCACPSFDSVWPKEEKSMFKHVQDVAANDHSQHVKIIKLWEREKTECEQIKHKIKHNIEIARMTHKKCQAERQCKHELHMMQQQIELEHL